MTDDDTPTPTAAANSRGFVNAGAASRQPEGSAATDATSIAIASLSMPPGPEMRCPSTMYAMNNAQFAKANA
jgi:hypothetical protein